MTEEGPEPAASSSEHQHAGRFADGVASDTWRVLAGSGTGDLAGLRGQVDFSAGHQDRYEIIFEYELG